MKSKVCIITAAMLPYAQSFGSCQRMFFLAKYLEEKNNSVVLISLKNTKYGYFGYTCNFTHFTLPLKKKGNFIWRAWKKVLFKIGYYKVINRIIYNELSINKAVLIKNWINDNKKEIISKIKRNNIDTVIVSGPPFTIFNIVPEIKKLNIKLIIDYRDPWNNLFEKETIPHRKEKKICISADHITTFSKKFSTDIIQKYSLGSKVITVFNGFSETAWKNIEIKSLQNKKLTIAYTGTYNLQKLDSLFYALQNFKYKNELLINFIGPVDLNNYKWKENLRGVVRFIDTISHENSLKYLYSSDIALVYYWRDDYRANYMITGKFFDYIRSECVIWGLGKDYYNYNELINEYKLGFTCNNTTEDISKFLLQIYNKWKKNELLSLRKNSQRLLSHFNRTYQYEKINEIC